MTNITDADPAAQRQYPIDRPLRPLHDRVLVRRIADRWNETNVVIPESAGMPSRYGVVVSHGPGRRRPDGSRCTLSVRAGQIVLFGRYTDFDDGELLLIQEADVVGIVEE